jgi:hypothetical protein
MRRSRMLLLGAMVTLLALAGGSLAKARTLPCGAQCVQNEQACERICDFHQTPSCDVTCVLNYDACLTSCGD